MFGFFFNKKRDEVRRLLTGRMNRRYFRQFRYGERVSPRGSYCEVMWVIPYAQRDVEPTFDAAFPVVTKDICPEGLSFTHNEPIDAERMLISLDGPVEMSFVLCTLQHMTPLGHGFYQIGLHPEEVVEIKPAQLSKLHHRIRADEERQTNALPC